MTTTYTSDGYQVTIETGLLKLRQRQPRTVTETTYHPDGSVETYHALPTDQTAAGGLAAALNRMPLMAAVVDSDEPKAWLVDLDCGFQRWAGPKTNRQVRTILRKCGFAKADIDAMVKECRANPQAYCPRQG